MQTHNLTMQHRSNGMRREACFLNGEQASLFISQLRKQHHRAGEVHPT